MKAMQHKITGYGLNQHDQTVLKSFLKLMNLGAVSPWVYTDMENAEVVVVDPDEKAGKEFVYGHMVGMHGGKQLVSVGDNTYGCQTLHSLSRPLHSGKLRIMFDRFERKFS